MSDIEFHTSDLTANCLKSVQLRLEGKIDPTAGRALYRGLVFGEACRYLHEGRETEPEHIVADAAAAVHKTLWKERRPISPAVLRDQDIIHAEIERMLRFYFEQVYIPVFSGGYKLIGCELPIRLTREVDGKEVEFASHLDLLVRNIETGRLVMVDWKWRDEVPSWHYLSRNMQFGMYALALKHGYIILDKQRVYMNEWPEMYWMHAGNLEPYKKSGKTATRSWSAGDARPLSEILIPVHIHESSQDQIVADFAERVRMARQGFWPKNPDPMGCRLCESARYCPSYEHQPATESNP